MLFKKLRSPRKRKATAAADTLSARSDFGPLPELADPIVIARPVSTHREGHLGMQGYAPRVTVSKNRKHCEGCKEPVRAGVRHICIYNAHNHMDTLTIEERDLLIDQLKKLGVKPAQ